MPLSTMALVSCLRDMLLVRRGFVLDEKNLLVGECMPFAIEPRDGR